jgi:hypothetical protein
MRQDEGEKLPQWMLDNDNAALEKGITDMI